MRHLCEADSPAQGFVATQEAVQLRAPESSERDSCDSEQQERPRRVSSRSPTLALWRQFFVVFPCLLDESQ
jgi:hypothetical protein